MNLTTHTPIYASTHPELGGKVLRYRFDNNYGASVVKHRGSYGGLEGRWELAVLRFEGDDWRLTYGTPITDDVIGYLREDDIPELLDRIAEL